MEIKSISKNLFGVKQKNCESNQTNPFGVSFKGNVIPKDIVSADVFVGPAKANIADKVAGKAKRVASAFVGSMGDVSAAISTRFNSMVSYGRRIKSNISSAFEQARSFRPMDCLRSAGESLKSNLSFSSDYNVGRLLKMESEGAMTNTENMFRDVLAERANLRLAMEG